MLDQAPPRSARLDLAVGIVGLWLAAGFLWDSWAHLHVGVETFFTPYHGIFYSAMLAGAVIVTTAAVRNRRRGYKGWALPYPYPQAMTGIAIFFLGGLGDLVWHTFFGIEERIEAVTSPTHLIIGAGVATVLSAPIRSAFAARDTLRSLRDQLPMLFALASILEFVHLGTSYAFDASVARMDAPPRAIATSPEYFMATAIDLYKTGTSLMIVIITAFVMMLLSVWLVSRFRLAPGAMTIFLVLGDGMIAAALTNDRPLLPIHLGMALAAGIAADLYLAWRGGGPLRGRSLQLFGALVPLVYYGFYFGLTIAVQGTWWSPTLIGGAMFWAMLVGAALATLANAPARVEVVAVPVPTGGLAPREVSALER